MGTSSSEVQKAETLTARRKRLIACLSCLFDALAAARLSQRPTGGNGGSAITNARPAGSASDRSRFLQTSCDSGRARGAAADGPRRPRSTERCSWHRPRPFAAHRGQCYSSGNEPTVHTAGRREALFSGPCSTAASRREPRNRSSRRHEKARSKRGASRNAEVRRSLH